jgi:hypothetical protein
VRRTTTDLLLLMVVATVCVVVLASAVTLAVLSVSRPEVDTTTAQATTRDGVAALIGLLAGFLAGRRPPE